MTEKTIVKGSVTGKVLKSNQPINFLGAIDKKTGSICLALTKNMICPANPSRVARYLTFSPRDWKQCRRIYNLFAKIKQCGSACNGLPEGRSHDIVASGCALANIPLFILSPDEYDSIKDGDEVSLG